MARRTKPVAVAALEQVCTVLAALDPEVQRRVLEAAAVLLNVSVDVSAVPKEQS